MDDTDRTLIEAGYVPDLETLRAPWREMVTGVINTATLTNTLVDSDDLLRLAAYAFGVASDGADKATVIRRLEMFLKEQYRRGRRNLLIVDEAQDLPQKALEQLRLLTNLEHDNHPLLQIFLVGQPQSP